VFLTQAVPVLGIPALVVLAGLWTKLVMRPRTRGKGSLNREDFVFGFDWMISSLVALVLFMIDRAIALRALHSNPTKAELSYFAIFFLKSILILTFGMLLSFSVLPYLVNAYGYRTTLSNQRELSVWWGVLMPDLFGAVVLLAVSTTGATHP
jgi:hypothetical protein